jgi:hypothetical protein
MAEESDDEVVVVTSPSVPNPVPSTPVAPFHGLPATLKTSPHPANLLDYKPDSGDELDGIEIIAHHHPMPDTNSKCVVVKSEAVSATLPKKGMQTETPFPSILRTLRKSAAKKETQEGG